MGDITSTQLVTIIILIASFAAILFLVANSLLTEGEVNKEVCHASVVAKSTLPEKGGIRLGDLSLRCQTENVCISTKGFGKGECSDAFFNSYTTKKVTSDVDKQTEEVHSVIADSMVECWAMMGEGKVDVFKEEVKKTSKCVICSRISFGTESKFSNEYQGFYEHLIRQKVPNKEVSYLDYLWPSQNTPVYNADTKLVDKYSKKDHAVVFFEVGEGNVGKLATIATGAGFGGSIGAYFGSAVGPIGTVVGGASGIVIGGVVGLFVPIGDGDNQNKAGVILVEYDVNNLKELGCTSFENLP